jgi:hypothetical protein
VKVVEAGDKAELGLWRMCGAEVKPQFKARVHNSAESGQSIQDGWEFLIK